MTNSEKKLLEKITELQTTIKVKNDILISYRELLDNYESEAEYMNATIERAQQDILNLRARLGE